MIKSAEDNSNRDRNERTALIKIEQDGTSNISDNDYNKGLFSAVSIEKKEERNTVKSCINIGTNRMEVVAVARMQEH